MILVDSSILITFLRTNDPKFTRLLSTIGAATCGIVRAELLSGARTPQDRALVSTLLGTLTAIPITEALWEQVGDNLAALRSKGITAPFPDVVLATLAVSLNVEFWTRDQHFKLFQPAIPGLLLFKEPP